MSKIHVLGSGYQRELLAQVPAENLPKTLGGKCECDKGCQYSDAGPWQDPTWVREPKWAKKKPGNTTTTDAAAPAPTPTTQPAEGTAPAPQPGAAPASEGVGRLDTHAHA